MGRLKEVCGALTAALWPWDFCRVIMMPRIKMPRRHIMTACMMWARLQGGIQDPPVQGAAAGSDG